MKAAAVALGIVLAAELPQQTPPRDTRPAGAATATVGGRVVDKDSGQPIYRAVVQLSLVTLGTRRVFETWTDREGHFEFPRVPAGAYTASAGPGEYRSTHQTQPYIPDPPATLGSPPIELAAGETRAIDFALTRTYAIDGRVVNDFGDPLAEVMVTPERLDRGGGAIRSVRTDDRGHFRLFGLPPGSYRVCAAGDGPANEPVSGGETIVTRYARACSPASQSAASGHGVKSGDVAGVVIIMPRAAAFTVSGRVVDEAGNPVLNGSLQIFRATLEPGAPSGYAQIERGIFTARGLTPGDYALRAASFPNLPSLASPGSQDAGYLKFRVDASDVTGLTIVTQRGADVKGHVVFEDGPPPPQPGMRTQVSMRFDIESQPVYRMEGLASAPLDGSHTFEMNRVRGPRIVTLAGLPFGWVVKSVRYRGTDITDIATEFTNVTDPRELQIVATSRTAKLAAIAIDEKGQRVEGATAFLLPAQPERWRAGPIVLPAPRPQDGMYRPRPILPGIYLLAALPSDEYARMLRSFDILKAVAAAAPQYRVTEAHAGVTEVPLRRIPEER